MNFWNLNQSGLLFVPRNWQRNAALQWLKRIHAWTGFWGALLFLMLGVSGVLLNHRSIWKIETGDPVEVSDMVVAVAPSRIRAEDDLKIWARQELKLDNELRPPRSEGAKKKAFLGSERAEAKKWALQSNHPNGRITIEYVPGSTGVTVRQDASNLLGVIKNLHKGTGAGVAWILFMDSIAGALIAMSITGFLLWTRLHGGRLLAGGIAIGALAIGTAAIAPQLI
jgi:hypothetical protein